MRVSYCSKHLWNISCLRVSYKNFSQYNLSTKSLFNNDISLWILPFFSTFCYYEFCFRLGPGNKAVPCIASKQTTKCQKIEVQIETQISDSSQLFGGRLSILWKMIRTNPKTRLISWRSTKILVRVVVVNKPENKIVSGTEVYINNHMHVFLRLLVVLLCFGGQNFPTSLWYMAEEAEFEAARPRRNFVRCFDCCSVVYK